LYAVTPSAKPAVWSIFAQLAPAFEVLWARAPGRIAATSSEKASILRGSEDQSQEMYVGDAAEHTMYEGRLSCGYPVLHPAAMHIRE
jgi:hypothetical protein